MSLRPFIIDCDTGRDDALAIWFALKLNLPLAGVLASYGNTILSNVIDNSARVLAFVGREDIPLWAGSSAPDRLHAGYEPVVHKRQLVSGNGLCNLELPKASRLLPAPLGPEQLASDLMDLSGRLGPLDYFIIGPATNFAALMKILGADLQKTIARVTMMGGKFDPLWSVMPAADFNIASDPLAVREIMGAGLKMRFVPLNATWPIQLSEPQIAQLVPHSALARFAQELMLAHCRHFAPEPIFRFHDPSVIAAALEPDGFGDVLLDIECREDSPDFGRLVLSDVGFACQVYEATDVARQRFLGNILTSLGFDPISPN